MTRVAVFNDTSTNGHIGCYAVMSTLDRELRLRGMQPVFYGPTGQDWRVIKTALRKLAIDLVVVNGEGSIHNSATRQWPRLLAQLGTFSRQELGVRSVLLNATTWKLEKTTLDHLRNFDTIYVRESASQQYLSQHGVGAELVPDLSFFSQFHPAQPRECCDDIVVTDSVLRNVTEHLAEFSKTNSTTLWRFRTPESEPFEKLMHRAKSWISRRSLRYMRPQSSSTKLDGVTFQGNSDYSNFMSALTASRMLFTGRFHAMTLAIKVRTPFVAFGSNTPKIGWVLTDIFGNRNRCLEANDLPEVFLNGQEFSAYEFFSTQELSLIDNYLNDGLVRKDRMFDRIAP